MATDETPPRNALILGIAFASVVTLGALKFIFDSYYTHIMEAEVAAKALPPVEFHAAQLADQQRLTQSPMPIDRAMQENAKTRGALIAPEQSTDDGAMVGWSKTPRTLAMAQAVDASAPLAADGGSAIPLATGDAGAIPAAALDAGAAVTVPSPAPPAPRAPAADAGKAPAPPVAPVPVAPVAPPQKQ